MDRPLSKELVKRLKKSVRRWWEEQRDHRRTRTYVLSFPKSGRTWLRLMIGKVMSDAFGLPEQEMLDTVGYAQRAGIPPFRFSHDGCASVGPQAVRQTESKRRYRDKKVLLLVRDPRDTIVSYYFECVHRQKAFEGTMSEFVRDATFGIPRIYGFYSEWERARNTPRGFLHLSYEKMHSAPETTLRQALDFLEVPGVGDDLVRRAVEFGEFENMKKLERDGFFGKRAMRPRDESDNETYKVRRGKVGGFVDYLSEEDLRWIDRFRRERPCALLDEVTRE
ncbi:sulfotransferase domain-containing protein [Candidatus Sumerlaeota bacterium]|nr:sulfotransferase domain-containing protein [Candidatus Sumerlaeota bacterium]